MLQLLKKYRHESFEDEDGNELILELHDKVSVRELKRFENEEGVALPSTLKELYLISNGLDLFGVEVSSLDALLYEPDHKAFQLHGWGDGSFDYIGTDGKIYFLDNHSGTLIRVAASLGDWMKKVIGEIKNKGVLMQPDDYTRSEETDGLYYSVYAALQKDTSGNSKAKKINPKLAVTKSKVAANVHAWDEIKRKFSDRNFCQMEDRIAKKNKTEVFRKNNNAFIAAARDDFEHSIYSFDFVARFTEQNEALITAFTKSFWKTKLDRGACVIGFSILFGLYFCYLNDKKEKELLGLLKKFGNPEAAKELQRIKRSYSEAQKQKQ